MTINAIASETHFVDHLAPVWLALPPEQRGTFWCGPTAAGAFKRARTRWGIQAEQRYPNDAGVVSTVMVASSGDMNRAVKAMPRAPIAFFEHGCGISYNVAQSSYVGSSRRPNVELFIMPNGICAAKQATATPGVDTVVIGSSPRLDQWIGHRPAPKQRPLVVLSFHWDCMVVPETRTALHHYRRHLGALVGHDDFDVAGHSHPRIAALAEPAYRRAKIPWIPTFDEVLDRADLYCVDNSSTLYEFAATKRPVVVMNCPYYRRSVNHGLRFWDNIPGLQCDEPRELLDTIRLALEDAPSVKRARTKAVKAVYPKNDGRAAERAAEAVLDLAGRGVRIVSSVEPGRRAGPEFTVRKPDGSIEEFWVLAEAKRYVAKMGGVLVDT